MSVKTILIEAGRYDQVMDILNKTTQLSDHSFPVNCYSDNGKASFRVDGSDVRNEAYNLIQGIETDAINTMVVDDFENLFQYVHSHTDMLLHNYAVNVSHGQSNPNPDMDNIRVWCILDNLIMCLGIQNCDDGWDWDIPDGWKARS